MGNLMNMKDEYITCPYEKSHRILLSRSQFHLVKCKYVNKDAKLVECPFNSCHKIKEPELTFHCNYWCPDRAKVDNFLCKSEDINTTIFELPKVEIHQESSECWDNEEYVTYNPDIHCQNAPLLLNKQGVTPSERKAFRQSERIRLQQLKNGNIAKQHTLLDNKFIESGLQQSCATTRLPKSSSKTIIGNENISPNFSTDQNIESMMIHENNTDNNNGFIQPRYARGRGRGRGRFTLLK